MPGGTILERVTGAVRRGRFAGSGWAPLFTVTLFVSSSLLFLVEPMFAKMVLPLLGGTPATWITCLLFFQAALLAGYAYAHWSTQRLGPRRQSLVHLAVALVGLAVLPIALPHGWRPPPSSDPIGWLLTVLAVSVGLPFFVVSSTAPLLQRWFASTRYALTRDPYSLYRASNLGSMLALLGYPVLVEPRFRLGDQGRLWTAGYIALVVLTGASALAAWQTPRPATVGGGEGEDVRPAPVAVPAPAEAPSDAPSAGRRARWVLFAFVPSSFMLAVTTHISTDVAAVPLVWVIPLALYLLSFVVVFSPRPSFLFDELTNGAQAYLVLTLVAAVVLGITAPLLVVVADNLLAFFPSPWCCTADWRRTALPANG